MLHTLLTTCNTCSLNKPVLPVLLLALPHLLPLHHHHPATLHLHHLLLAHLAEVAATTM